MRRIYQIPDGPYLDLDQVVAIWPGIYVPGRGYVRLAYQMAGASDPVQIDVTLQAAIPMAVDYKQPQACIDQQLAARDKAFKAEAENIWNDFYNAWRYSPDSESC